MNRNTVVIAVVLLVVVGMLAAGKYLSSRQRIPTGESLLPRDPVGAVAPDFTLTTVDGKQVKLSDLRGKAVLLNFWATWCAPCKIEIPWFLELEKQYRPQGLVILGVAMDDDAKDKIGDFAKEMKIDYPVLVGTDKVADNYGGVDGLPTTFYIGRDGKIVKQVQGLISESDVEQGIQAALKQGTSSTGTQASSATSPDMAATSGKTAQQ